VLDEPRDVTGGGTAGPGTEITPSEPSGSDASGQDIPALTQCASCLAPNVPDARYCERCGTEMASAVAATLVFDPRHSGRGHSGGSPGAQDGSSGPNSTRRLGEEEHRAASHEGPSFGRTISGQTASALLLLTRRELADDYEVEREIGRGGMAIVYRAIDRQLRRTVALKVLPPELAQGPAVIERFQREARMAAAMDHPNIIPIYRVGHSESLLYLAMKYIEGRPLDAIIADQGALPIPVVLLVLRAGASALAYAHEHGIVHRDIKGGNLLIDQTGRAVVTDFGVARAIDTAAMTQTGSVIGTPYFMSPEQCAGKVAGPQSDQYSLGVVAFQMLTGSVPFEADTLAAIMHHHFFTPVPDVTKVREDVPPALSAVLERILSKDPARRFETTAAMQAAIDAIPLTDAEREQGQAMLRNLARGTAVPPVRTSALPPLADTMVVVAAHDAFMRSAERIKRVRRRASVGVAITVAAGLTLMFGRQALAPPARTAALAPTKATSVTVATPSPSPPRVTGAESAGATTGERASGTRPALTGRSRASPATSAESAATTAIATPDTATGKLRVRAIPGTADIVIDGTTIGQGAIVDRDVLAGTRRLHISAPGYDEFDTTIVVRAGETTRLNPIELKAEP
jgi:predicted Ser/Thr protein kinase